MDNVMLFNVDGQDKAITAIYDGDAWQADYSHPNFSQMTALVRQGGELSDLIDLFDIERTLTNTFERISSRITVEHGEVFYDGDPLHNSVSGHILRFVSEGLTSELEAVANFTERVMTNPSENSRKQLFGWLDAENFTITREGKIVGYKRCRLLDGVPVSYHEAPDYDKVRVDDVLVTGPVPNLPGSTVTMPRSLVADDPTAHCSRGLHIGNYNYANGFFKSYGEVMNEVHVDPADVVSVPNDHGFGKMRACRYTIIGPVEEKYTGALVKTDVTKAEEVKPVVDDVIRVGDIVRTVKDVIGISSGSVPHGSLATVTEVTSSGYHVTWKDSANGQSGSWIKDRFEKVADDKVDTRENHTRQERYPAGHPKAGQFKPKGQ